MTTCHGCHRPLEPLAAILTYHSGCDPQGRVEMLERALRTILDYLDPTSASGMGTDRIAIVTGVARAALDYRPAQIRTEWHHREAIKELCDGR